jgi:hypothetical protein
VGFLAPLRARVDLEGAPPHRRQARLAEHRIACSIDSRPYGIVGSIEPSRPYLTRPPRNVRPTTCSTPRFRAARPRFQDDRPSSAPRSPDRRPVGRGVGTAEPLVADRRPCHRASALRCRHVRGTIYLRRRQRRDLRDSAGAQWTPALAGTPHPGFQRSRRSGRSRPLTTWPRSEPIPRGAGREQLADLYRQLGWSAGTLRRGSSSSSASNRTLEQAVGCDAQGEAARPTRSCTS